MSVVMERQAPLRREYERAPEEALTRKLARTRTTESSRADDPFHGLVEIGEGYGTTLHYGLDRYVGGLHDLPNPGDLLCAALATCLDGTIRMVANLLGVELERLEVEVAAELDVRGTLAVDLSVPVGFQQLPCRVRLTPAAGTDPDAVARLLETAERACVNADTLRRGASVAIELV